jgi:drug/metabolite transporter (DMT)-like permease
VALFLGRVLGGEALGPRTLLAAALVIASVVLITTARAGSPARDARARVATTGEETA